MEQPAASALSDHISQNIDGVVALQRREWEATNLVTEQKVTKVIHLLEELRRDLPMVKDRHDPQATQMQERTDTARLASALDEVGLTSDPEEYRPPTRADD